MAMNFEPYECVNFAQSTIIGTHENKAIHSIWCCSYLSCDCWNKHSFHIIQHIVECHFLSAEIPAMQS